MVPSPPAVPSPLVVGTNQRTSPLAVRDRLHVDPLAYLPLLRRIRDGGVRQAIVVATCDRIEVYAVDAHVAMTTRCLVEVLAEHGGFTLDALQPHLYTLSGEGAVRHLFRVAASLDSLIVGEPNILGQIKASLRTSREVGMTGKALEGLLQAAFASAKRVRSETTLGTRPVSLATAAVELARQIHGDLGRCRAVLLGTGELGELVADALLDHGLGHLAVADPRSERADAFASSRTCHVMPFEPLADALAAADIVLGAIGGRHYAVNRHMVRRALKARRNAPQFLVDLAVPGDLDPAIDGLEDAFLYGLDDLERVARRGRTSRESDEREALGIVGEGVDAYLRERAERAAVPLVARLRRHFEATRLAAMADAGGDAERATQLLVNRLLHGPSRSLRELAGQRDGGADELPAVEEILARLFDLPGGDEED
jgi:glutamyl-tRNA reductase